MIMSSDSGEVAIKMTNSRTKNKHEYLETDLGKDIFEEPVISKSRRHASKRKKSNEEPIPIELEAKNNWTLDLSKRLQYFSYNSFSLRFMHGEDAKYYTTLLNRLTFYVGIMSLFAGIIVGGLLTLFSLEIERFLVFLTLAKV